MTRVMQQMREERRYYQKRLDHMEPGDIQQYQVHLLEDRRLGVGTVINHVAVAMSVRQDAEATRDEQDMPYPKHERRLPAVPSVEEVTR